MNATKEEKKKKLTKMDILVIIVSIQKSVTSISIKIRGKTPKLVFQLSYSESHSPSLISGKSWSGWAEFNPINLLKNPTRSLGGRRFL